MSSLDTEKLRKDFRILEKNLIYMDSSCVSLKPNQVVEEITRYYYEYPACGARSSHKLALKVTAMVDETRKKTASFLNARKKEEIIFTKNTTEGINLVANSYPFQKGDKILVSDREHNSNLIPWQILAKRKGINLEFFKFNDLTSFEEKVKGAKFVSFVQTSNLDGSTQKAEQIIKMAHKVGAKVLIDGAQSAPHKEVDLKKIDADFFVCSGHKMLGPSGTGLLYGKYGALQELQQFMTGGETVKDSTYQTFEPEEIPHKFEAGLQDYSGIAGFGAALDYLKKIGLEKISRHETKLNKQITEGMSEIKDLQILGPENPEDRGGIISFNIRGVDPHNIALQLDSQANVMIRSGYHCCHSWFNANKIRGSARASLYLYNTEEEAKKFLTTLKQAVKILK